MGTKLFVGNLNPRTTKPQLEQFFSAAGRVASIGLPVDRETGQPRGFCFVEFTESEGAEQALALCDGRELDGRKVRLSWAREKEDGRAPRQTRPSRDARSSYAERGADNPPAVGGGREVKWYDDYAEKRRVKPQRHGRHGSDRKSSRGTRRVIE